MEYGTSCRITREVLKGSTTYVSNKNEISEFSYNYVMFSVIPCDIPKLSIALHSPS